MTVHQKFGPPAYEFHPELGYLCPSRQLRQNVRVGLAAAAFGLIAGVAATATLLPRHGSDLTPTEPALAAAAGWVGDPTPLTLPSTSVISPRAPSGSAERGSTGAAVKPPAPAAPTSPAAETANAPPAVVVTPAAPVVISEPARAVPSKRAKTAHSVARRRWREPAPTDAFATSPFGLQTSRFADETRSGRSGRRSGWGWGGDWRW